jgi:thiol-disulfide isomerase/thioredoxin
MKLIIIPVLLAFVAMTGQAKIYKTIKEPAAMACVNVYYGELRAREVVMTDTATTVRFTMEYERGRSFRFVSSSYLMDEDGRRYPLRSVEGLRTDAWVESPESGVTEFTMHFEPLPKGVQVFDFIEGDVSRAFMLLGIHDRKTRLKAPTVQELVKENPCTWPRDWFKTDTVTVKGRIEDYDAERFGFTTMECYFEDVFEANSTTLVLDIAEDGSFCKKFLVSNPVMESFYTMESKVGFERMPFFACPGETIDITVSRNGRGQYECVYNNGSCRDVERWLRSYELFGYLAYPLHVFKGSLAEANRKAEDIWQNMLYRFQSVNRREHFTPMEVQLGLADMQVTFAYAYLDYFMNREYGLMKQEERDGVYYTDITDTVEWRAIHDGANYTILHRVDFDNPLLFAGNHFSALLNRVQYAEPVRERQYSSMMDENGVYEDNVKNNQKKLTIGLAALRDFMGTDHDNLMAQLCTYKDLLDNFNYWRNKEEAIPRILADTTMTEIERKQGVEEMATLSKMYPFYLASFTHPYFRQKAEQFYAYKMAQTELATPLPDVPMADLIRNLSAKFPGKFLIIDFWGMGCGPCRSAIQSSKQKRAEIAKRDDVKLVFIAEERTAEGSDSYHKYVSEWLADEETICVTYSDFARLQEMFQFNGIPHYEVITPDCRRVRDDLRLNGFYNFDSDVERLKERLK